MRVLVYGMQSSGASLVTLTLAQKRECVAFVDIWNMFAAPELKTDHDIVAKVVVTTAFSLEVHRRRFRPDATILVLRHPVDTYDSLIVKSYAHEGGLIDEKFAVLEEVFRSGTAFDHMIHYEDFVFSPRSLIVLCERIGWQIDCDALLFPRTRREIEETNASLLPGINGRLKYGIGNTQTVGVLRDRIKLSDSSARAAHLRLLCPSLVDHYVALGAERGAMWHVSCPPVLSCRLNAIVRGLSGLGDTPQQSAFAGYRLEVTGGIPRCRVTDDGLILSPPDTGETCLTVSGLPGRPFNRVSGAAHGVHPRGRGTHASIRVEGEDGECLAQREFVLCHSDMRPFDLRFQARRTRVAVRILLRLAEGVDSAIDSEVEFRDLRLEQVAV